MGERGGTQRPERCRPFCAHRPAGVSPHRSAVVRDGARGQNCRGTRSSHLSLLPAPRPPPALLLKDPSPARSPPPAAQPRSQSRPDVEHRPAGTAQRCLPPHSPAQRAALRDRPQVRPATQEGFWPPRPRHRDPGQWESRGQPSPLGPGADSRAAPPCHDSAPPRSVPTPPPAHPEPPARGSGATYLRGGEQLQLAQPLQHALHVVLQGPHGAGHVGVQLRQQLLLHGSGLGGAPRVLLCPGELRICGSKGR